MVIIIGIMDNVIVIVVVEDVFFIVYRSLDCIIVVVILN